jgi:hypothetical protein
MSFLIVIERESPKKSEKVIKDSLEVKDELHKAGNNQERTIFKGSLKM